jgi:hypothetical protein
MRKVSIILPSVILLILIFKVSSNTVTNKKELGSTVRDFYGFVYDGSYFFTIANNNILTYMTALTSKMLGSFSYHPFIIYQRSTLVLDLENGNYQIWTVSSSAATQISNPEPSLGQKSEKMFYFHPDPTLYIQHYGELEKLYRYDIDPSAGTITPKADPFFDFGIGNLAFIEKTEQGFLGASSTAEGGYYRVTHISAVDGRTLNTISTYFKKEITGLSYSPKKKQFFITSGASIFVWDINDFTYPVFSRTIFTVSESKILQSVFSYDGDLVMYILDGTVKSYLVNPVKYAITTSIYEKSISNFGSPKTMMRLPSDIAYFILIYNTNTGTISTRFDSYTTNLDPSCMPGFSVCYCDPKSATPLLDPNTGVCVATCPAKTYLGTCQSTCPTDSTANGNVCVPKYQCPVQCKDCKSQNCARCETNHYLYSTTKTSTYDVCIPSSLLKGYFFLNTNSDGTGIVRKCAPGCSICANARKCLVCSP